MGAGKAVSKEAINVTNNEEPTEMRRQSLASRAGMIEETGECFGA